MTRVRLLLVIALALPAGRPAAAQDVDELRRLRVLIVLDTKSNLVESVMEDGDRIKKLFRDHVPQRRYTLDVLTGANMSEASILDYYRKLQTGPDEGLVFFYAGHGAYDDREGHYFELQRGDKVIPVLRKTVVRAMEAKRAGLVVILSDCCSTRTPLVKVKPPKSEVGTRGTTSLHPTVRALFFQHRGMVDITAASKGQGSWGDCEDGGVFTRTFARVVVQRPSRFAGAAPADASVAVTWKDFFPVLARETENTFRAWTKAMTARGELDAEVRGSIHRQGTQRPFAFHLADPAVRAVATAEPSGGGPGKKVYAVVSLCNQTDEELRFKVRWPGQAWQDRRLAAREKTVFTLPLPADAKLPSLEAKIDGIAHVLTLGARRSTRAEPRYEDGEEHEIRLK